MVPLSRRTFLSHAAVGVTAGAAAAAAAGIVVGQGLTGAKIGASRVQGPPLSVGDPVIVHLKDVTAVGEPHLTCRWGDGVVPVEACVRTLRRIGYAAAVSVEHEPYDHDPAEEVRAMRAELEEWLA